MVSTSPFYSIAVGGIELQVREDDVPEALIVLDELDNIELNIDTSIYTCPNCGSSDIKYGYIEKDKPGFIDVIVVIFSQVLPFLRRKKCQCHNCKHIFKKPK